MGAVHARRLGARVYRVRGRDGARGGGRATGRTTRWSASCSASGARDAATRSRTSTHYRREMLKATLLVTDWARERAREIVLDPPVPLAPCSRCSRRPTSSPSRCCRTGIRREYGFSPLPPALCASRCRGWGRVREARGPSVPAGPASLHPRGVMEERALQRVALAPELAPLVGVVGPLLSPPLVSRPVGYARCPPDGPSRACRCASTPGDPERGPIHLLASFALQLLTEVLVLEARRDAPLGEEELQGLAREAARRAPSPGAQVREGDRARCRDGGSLRFGLGGPHGLCPHMSIRGRLPSGSLMYRIHC